MDRILDTINNPADLRHLSMAELEKLAQELREEIIKTTALSGGHLAPNLGVVELTLALHYAFDTPKDKLIWDVGHQCYAHKLITGRKDAFHTLRQTDGISGFCSRKESDYDCFTTGHCSNSISLALGMAKARDISGADHKVIAVIGDGALDGGIAFEGLNHAGDISSPLLVVLNDNKMSINRNVGALHRHLDKLRSNPKYATAKRNIQSMLEHIPLLGKPMAKGISKLKNKLKSLLVPGMYFEDLGFTYLGPIDGHNIPALIEILRRAATIDRPVLVHALTDKGKGYAPAEARPRLWHGVDPFYVETGAPATTLKTEKSYTQTFGETIIDMAKADPRIIAITAAMTDGTGLAGFKERFPERFFDVGIAEQHATSFSAGLANDGMHPILAIYSSFLQRAYDQIIEDICLQKLPVIIGVDRAGLVGQDGCTHQGMFDITYLRSIPNLTVMAPASTKELQSMLHFALSLNSPVAIRYPRGCGGINNEISPLQYGKSAVVQDGDDAVIFALGAMVDIALQAAKILGEQGINIRVINARFASPIDRDMLNKGAKECHGRIVTIEDNIIDGGFGEGCLRELSGCGNEVMICGLPKKFIPHGKREELLSRLGLDACSIAEKIFDKWFK